MKQCDIIPYKKLLSEAYQLTIDKKNNPNMITKYNLQSRVQRLDGVYLIHIGYIGNVRQSHT